MRKPTEEQKARSAERKARMRELASRVSKMSVEERTAFAGSIPVMTIEGRSLSVFNQCLVMMQTRGASIVGGFRQWLKAGRAVRKGEHGACIWVPIGQGKDEEGEPGEVHFILGTIFDVSQTDEIVGVTSGETQPENALALVA